jgi:hypothetical protein
MRLPRDHHVKSKCCNECCDDKYEGDVAHQENRHWFDKCTVGVSGDRPVGWLQFHCLRPSNAGAPRNSFIASTTILRVLSRFARRRAENETAISTSPMSGVMKAFRVQPWQAGRQARSPTNPKCDIGDFPETQWHESGFGGAGQCHLISIQPSLLAGWPVVTGMM